MRSALPIKALVAVLTVMLVAACRHTNGTESGAARTTVPRTGGLYSLVDEGGFKVAKVLVVDDTATHVRVYKNRFASRPLAVVEAELSLGTIHDPDGFGMGHLPLSHAAFERLQPVFIQASTVTEAEREGYEEWRKAGGGLWP